MQGLKSFLNNCQCKQYISKIFYSIDNIVSIQVQNSNYIILLNVTNRGTIEIYFSNKENFEKYIGKQIQSGIKYIGIQLQAFLTPEYCLIPYKKNNILFLKFIKSSRKMFERIFEVLVDSLTLGVEVESEYFIPEYKNISFFIKNINHKKNFCTQKLDGHYDSYQFFFYKDILSNFNDFEEASKKIHSLLVKVGTDKFKNPCFYRWKKNFLLLVLCNDASVKAIPINIDFNNWTITI